MSALSDIIEEFIKGMMTDEDGRVELQRNELAAHFRCAPSQINYVLATRFSLDRGYMIESRKGGGGYIRVIRVSIKPEDYIAYLVTERIGDELTAQEAEGIIKTLEERELVTGREAAIISAALRDKSGVMDAGDRNRARASMLRAMLTAIVYKEGGA